MIGQKNNVHLTLPKIVHLKFGYYMSLIEIDINDNGEHWHKRVSVLGICVYHRHDYTKNAQKRIVGFNAMIPVSGEIEDEECCEQNDIN